MDLLLMILLLFLACVKAEGQTEVKVVKVEPGQNATLNCSKNTSNIFWYMEIHSHFRGCISRTIGEDQQYFVFPSGTKYVVMKANRLLITNVSAEDCRLYYCAWRQVDRIVFDDVFRIVQDVPIPPSTREPQQMERKWPEGVIFGSLALNGLLVLTGLLLTVLCVRRNCSRPPDDPSQLTSENPESPEAPQVDRLRDATLTAVTTSAGRSACILCRSTSVGTVLPVCSPAVCFSKRRSSSPTRESPRLLTLLRSVFTPKLSSLDRLLDRW